MKRFIFLLLVVFTTIIASSEKEECVINGGKWVWNGGLDKWNCSLNNATEESLCVESGGKWVQSNYTTKTYKGRCKSKQELIEEEKKSQNMDAMIERNKARNLECQNIGGKMVWIDTINEWRCDLILEQECVNNGGKWIGLSQQNQSDYTAACKSKEALHKEQEKEKEKILYVKKKKIREKKEKILKTHRSQKLKLFLDKKNINCESSEWDGKWTDDNYPIGKGSLKCNNEVGDSVFRYFIDTTISQNQNLSKGKIFAERVKGLGFLGWGTRSKGFNMNFSTENDILPTVSILRDRAFDSFNEKINRYKNTASTNYYNSSDLKNMCLGTYNKYSSFCYKINDNDLKNSCLAMKEYPSFAYKINNMDLKNFTLGASGQYSNFCYKVNNDDLKNACLGINNNTLNCYNIKDKNLQNMCLGISKNSNFCYNIH